MRYFFQRLRYIILGADPPPIRPHFRTLNCPHFPLSTTSLESIYHGLIVYCLMASGKVRINENLLRSIDAYLESELAKSKGFRYRREVVEEAVRQFLEREGFYSNNRFKHVNMDGNYVIILDKLIKRVVTVYFKHPDIVYCDVCGSSLCEHVSYVLTLKNIYKILRCRGFRITYELVEENLNRLYLGKYLENPLKHYGSSKPSHRGRPSSSQSRQPSHAVYA